MPPMPEVPPLPSIDIDVPNIIVLQSSSRNGVLVEDLTPQLAAFFGVKNGQGVLVRSVERGSPAASAGLKAGDVIVKIANQPITCSSDWRRMMHEHHGSVALAVVRDKREQNVTIKLPDKSSDSSLHIELPNFNDDMTELRAEMDRLRSQIASQVEMARAQLQQIDLRQIDQTMKLRCRDWERISASH
jgi:predicted metalloprotease with PDZ domain